MLSWVIAGRRERSAHHVEHVGYRVVNAFPVGRLAVNLLGRFVRTRNPTSDLKASVFQAAAAACDFVDLRRLHVLHFLFLSS